MVEKRISDGGQATMRVFQAIFPWMKFLPLKERQDFVDEFVEAVHGRAVGNTLSLDEIVHGWHSTARIHSDPELAAELQRSDEPSVDGETFGVRLCKWLRTANAQLKGKTPLEVLAAGDFQVVADFVDDLMTGSLT